MRAFERSAGESNVQPGWRNKALRLSFPTFSLLYTCPPFSFDVQLMNLLHASQRKLEPFEGNPLILLLPQGVKYLHVRPGLLPSLRLRKWCPCQRVQASLSPPCPSPRRCYGVWSLSLSLLHLSFSLLSTCLSFSTEALPTA